MLAIIIPFFKLTFFEATLESLGNQTDKRFKVYIGDDASTEDCSGLLQHFEGSFDFMYHRFEENLGGISLTQQWDRCIALSRDEEWLMILGDDDVLGENVVDEFYKNLETFKGKTNIIRFRSQLINERCVAQLDPTINPVWETAQKSFLRKINRQTRSSLSEYIFSKYSYLKFGFTNYPLAWHSDDKAWLDFANLQPIYSIQEGIIYVRLSSENISGQKSNSNLKNQSSLLFLKDILLQKRHLGSKKDIASIMLSFEGIIKKNRKLNNYEWKYLLKMHILNFEIISLSKFIRRYFISVTK